MKCSSCGAEVGNARFCSFCGTQITTAQLKEQELLNKQGCPKCGSTNVTFHRENQGEIRDKKSKQIIHQTVGVCKDCGYTWYTTESSKKKSNTWLWVLGWIFIFPVPLTILLLRKKDMKPALKYGIIAAMWIVFGLIAIFGRGSGSDNNWPSGKLADRIPQYSDTVKRTRTNSNSLSITVDDVEITNFEEYAEECKEYGFIIDARSTNTTYDAYDKEGYKLRLNYNASSKELRIDVQIPASSRAAAPSATDVQTRTPDATDPPVPSEDSEPIADGGGYESIYNEYEELLRSKTEQLLEEFKAEAQQNTEGITGLAEICNQKIFVLAEIENEGVQKMATYAMTHDLGSSSAYSDWAAKLYTVYEEESGRIVDYYMKLS